MTDPKPVNNCAYHITPFNFNLGVQKKKVRT